jgi:hypothetical protein
MPEQLTKYPDVTMQVLESAGARCGAGGPQKILKQCPAERFCSLPGGEMCVYGVEETLQMTQIAPADLATVVCPPADSAKASMIPDFGSAALFLGIGVIIGAVLRKRA